MIEPKVKQARMKMEVKFARDSSITLPRVDPLFTIQITQANKKRRDKTVLEFEFKNKLNAEMMKLLGIRQCLNTPYHPQSNGLDERFNRVDIFQIGTEVLKKDYLTAPFLHQESNLSAPPASISPQQSTHQPPHSNPLHQPLHSNPLHQPLHSFTSLSTAPPASPQLHQPLYSSTSLSTAPPASPQQSTPPASPQQSTPPASPQQSTPPASPQQSTPPASPQQSTPPPSPQQSTPSASPHESTPPASPQQYIPHYHSMNNNLLQVNSVNEGSYKCSEDEVLFSRFKSEMDRLKPELIAIISAITSQLHNVYWHGNKQEKSAIHHGCNYGPITTLPDLLGSPNEEPEVDLTAINADTPYSAALSLLDMMFTQEELRKSLLMKSKKSSRPGLPEDRVRKMIDCLKKKFGANSFDIKVLKRKCNQKCRDVNRSYLRLHDEEGTELMPPRHEEEEKEQQEDKEEEKEEDNEDDEEEDDEEEEEEEDDDDDDEKEVEEHFSL
ncbi:hypothetical protein EMCRGX_G003478 [Ephydatia muelleri]